MKKAFTMIEIIFVIVILGILSSVAISKMAVTRDDAIISKGRSEVAAIRNAISLKRNSNILMGKGASYPSKLDALSASSSGDGDALFDHDTNSSDSNNSVTLTSSDYTRLMVNRVGDLKKYDIVQLNHLRNGIFAQIGLDFSKTNPALDNLFKRFDWYKPTITSGSVAYNKLSKLQKDNVQALLKEEKHRCGGNLTLADFYRVKVKALTAEYLKRYSKKDLKILRNSLIARYGFIFKDQKLNKVFSNMPWYKPNPEIRASEIIDKKMSDIERANIQTILKVEKE